MAIRTGKVILAKDINLDRDHKNVLDYSESDMLTLLNNNAVYSTQNCSFLRQGANTIDVDVSYGNALKCNYLAFQNPDYSNKWFFAFVDDIEYISEKSTRISYTIDDFATWYSYWTPKACYVVREHTNDDTVGNNLLPENLETGEYVSNGDRKFLFGGSVYYVIMSTYDPNNDGYYGSEIYGVPISGTLSIFPYWQQMINGINQMARNSKLDTISACYMIPETAVDPEDLEMVFWTTPETDEEMFYRIHYATGHSSHNPRKYTTNITAPSTIDGYIPHNNKLLTAPYQYMMVSNTNGSSNLLAYEYFTDRTACTFETIATPVIGVSAMVYPKNYKGIENNYNEGLMAGKYPTLSWSADIYTNWLTQNAVNLNLGVIGDLIGGVTGLGKGLFEASNPANKTPELTKVNMGLGVINTGLSIANTMATVYQHSLVPVVSRGNVNGGDVLTANKSNSVFVYKMSIRSDFAQRIDQYFDRYGYATNKIKIPNQTGRTYWNYVQIANTEEIGYNNQDQSVPTVAMENINNIFRVGTTIWHNHANVGNYSLDNSLGNPSVVDFSTIAYSGSGSGTSATTVSRVGSTYTFTNGVNGGYGLRFTQAGLQLLQNSTYKFVATIASTNCPTGVRCQVASAFNSTSAIIYGRSGFSGDTIEVTFTTKSSNISSSASLDITNLSASSTTVLTNLKLVKLS